MNAAFQTMAWAEAYSQNTQAKLRIYLDLLNRWNPAINLVSPASLPDALTRHLADSAQLLDFCPPSGGVWADLGSGGGFPGLVVALLAQERHPKMTFVLVESDARKAAFLSTVSREVEVPVTVLSQRIETIPPLGASIVSARALAPLPRLLGLAFRHLGVGGTCLFHKGVRFESEVKEARKDWVFDLMVHPSKVETGSVLLEIKGLKRV